MKVICTFIWRVSRRNRARRTRCGASQLPGARELAGLILDKQVRLGRPLRIAGLAEATGGPAFATSAGLIHFALSERAETLRQGRAFAEEPGGLIGRFGLWIREHL